MRISSFCITLAIACANMATTTAQAQTINGKTVLASYGAPGLCADANRDTKEIRLNACAPTNSQEFYIEYFHDIARHEAKRKIMNGKDCLQAGWIMGRAAYFTERCSISTWSKSAFWGIGSSGDLYSEDHYCAYRKEGETNVGTLLEAQKCRWFEGAEIYPAILTRSAQIGPLTLANIANAQSYKAIVVENGYSAGNLIASEGSQLMIDGNGRVRASSGGYIISGGAGYRINEIVSQINGAKILKSSDLKLKQPDDYSPRDLDFFTEKTRGKLDYNLH